jgi:hypothetical protein
VLLALHTRAGEQAGLSLGDVQGFLQTIQSLVKLPVPMTYGSFTLCRRHKPHHSFNVLCQRYPLLSR